MFFCWILLFPYIYIYIYTFYDIYGREKSFLVFSYSFYMSFFIFLFSEQDWYVPRGKWSHRQILTIVFVCKNIIRSGKCNKSQYQVDLEKARDVRFRIEEIENEPWSRVRNVVKAMVLKYKTEGDHDMFERFVQLSRAMWRKDNEELDK